MHWIDLTILLGFLIFSLGFAFFSSRKEKSLSAHFQSEGKLSWFISGTAMVATTFAADTPLAVTELVHQYGISGNWLWWYMGIGSLFTVYVFAPLWKRSGVVTDVELVKIRYGGSGTNFLRGFKALYMGLFLNIIILAWVNLAMQKIAQVLLPDLNSMVFVSLLCFFAFLYTAWVGLTGISYTDAFQFFFAIGGCILLAFLALGRPEIGGRAGLVETLSSETLSFFPDIHSKASPFGLERFILLISVAWWASWYPGAEPGGGGYIAQRIMATKDESSAILSSLWFVIAHYFVRPWPWILVALVSVKLYPNLSPEESGKGFVYVMKETLPVGAFGILIASFLAAYLSTIATHLNWGTSYIILDLYKPFLQKEKSERHYLWMSKVVEVFLMIFSLLICFFLLDSISGTWKFLIEAGAGVGFALVARWFIPSITAWGEFSGFCAPLILHFLGRKFNLWHENYSLLFNTLGTIIIVLIISKFTKNNLSLLKDFYLKVKPPGVFWRRWAIENGIRPEESSLSLGRSIVLVLFGLILVYSGLYLTGEITLGTNRNLFLSFILLIIGVMGTYLLFPKKKKSI